MSIAKMAAHACEKQQFYFTVSCFLLGTGERNSVSNSLIGAKI